MLQLSPVPQSGNGLQTKNKRGAVRSVLAVSPLFYHTFATLASSSFFEFPHYHTMKILGLAVVRTGPELNEPIPLATANDLSSFGFFQRQVGNARTNDRRRPRVVMSRSNATIEMTMANASKQASNGMMQAQASEDDHIEFLLGGCCYAT